MSPRTVTSCPHERRPGTTVCLKCRNDERAAKRGRQARVLGGVALVGVAVTVFAMVGTAGADALHNRRQATAPERDTSAQSAEPAPARPRAASGGGAPAPVHGVAPIAARVPEGRTVLRDSVYAMRVGSTVTVHFDVPMMRTRRRDKFESIVRTTLPAVYGRAVDSLLAAVPVGRLIAPGADLLVDLPTNGLRIPANAGWTLALWPETRPGQDGPLVVAYRVTVTR